MLAGAFLGTRLSLWKGTGQPVTSLHADHLARVAGIWAWVKSPPGLVSRPQEVMPPGSLGQLWLAQHGSARQADVLEATSLTQRVWELRYSLPGGGGRQGQSLHC